MWRSKILAHDIVKSKMNQSNDIVDMNNINKNINFEKLNDAEMEFVAIHAQKEVYARIRNEAKRNNKKIERLEVRTTEHHEWSKKKFVEAKAFENETATDLTEIKKFNVANQRLGEHRHNLVMARTKSLQTKNDLTESKLEKLEKTLTVDAEKSKEILLRCHARALHLFNGGYFNGSNFDTENKAKRFARTSCLDKFKVNHEKNILLKDYHDAISFADSWLPNLSIKYKK
jgi:hypothetical protein